MEDKVNKDIPDAKQDNNSIVIDKIDELENRLKAQDIRINEIIAFNRELLNRRINTNESKENNAKEKLNNFIMKGEK